jgi:hypothetical protein
LVSQTHVFKEEAPDYGTGTQGIPNFHPDLEHFGGGEQSGGGIGDILASRRVKGVLRPWLEYRQI